MKLVVGLGNPGKEYENTRHNVGFMVIDKFLSKHQIINFKTKFDGIYYETNIGPEKIILVKPQKYMNLSGEVVIQYLKYFKVSIDDLLIISDDLDMPLGKIKLKLSGSCGGHNGLRNIENHIGTQNYKRLKIGISNNKNIDTKDYVLGHINSEDMKVLESSIETGANIIEEFVSIKFDNIMNKYN